MKISPLHIFLTLLLFLLFVCDGHTTSDLTVSNVTSVIDGDTFRANIEGFPEFFNNIGVRIYGIDAPELRGTDPETKARAIKAKNFLAKKLTHAKRIILKNPKRGKYFRVVAEVWADGTDLAKEMIMNGLALAYSVNKK